MFGLVWDADVLGEAELIAGIAALETAFASFRVPLQQAGDQAAATIGENIVRNIDNFAPLAPSTLYQTGSYRLGGPLYRTGQLVEVVTDTTGSREGSAYNLTEDSVTVGLDEEAEIGKIGLRLTRGDIEKNLPARPFVRLLDSDVERITGYFADYVEKAVIDAFSARTY